MKRIGRVASKMAKENLFLYNLYVVLMAFLFSSIIYFVGGAAILLALLLLFLIFHGFMPTFLSDKNWLSIVLTCMVSLAVGVGFFSLVAIATNLKFIKK